MAETSGFFNSLNGDRKYTAEQITTHFEGLISNGVYESVGDALQVTAGSGMTVSVGTGKAVIQGYWYRNDAPMEVAITASHVTLNRYTSIILRLDLEERQITLMAIDGNNASSPTSPSLTRTDTVYDIELATIEVEAGATSISQANITDHRANTDVCGWVTGLIEQVDTSDLFLQWQSAYEAFYEEMESWKAAQKAAIAEFISELTTTLNVTATLQKLQATYITEAEMNDIPINISSYDMENDVLLVHINGVLLIEGEEYEIYSSTGETGDASILLTNTVKADNTITFIVLKSSMIDVVE